MQETFHIILSLSERFGLIVGIIFLLMSIAPRKRFNESQSTSRTILITLLFGAFGIFGTYTGNSVFNSVANLRAMVVITGGLFGGPVVGVGAGLIAGIHRIATDLNGFSAWPCGIATCLEGAIAGFVSYKLREKAMNWRLAATIAVLGESIHMLLILNLSKPFDEAINLVKIIAPPMLIINSIGAALFVEVINIFSRDRDRQESLHAQMILDIANSTVSHLRAGLSPTTAQATALILLKKVQVGAVAITDSKNVLAHVGAGDDHHLSGHEIRTNATRSVLKTGNPVFIHSAEGIGCNHKNCPMTSGIVVPLLKGTNIIGTLKFYGTEKKPLNSTMFELAKGLANLFSTQLELQDIQIKERMVAHAEIRRLQSQINPHFLFNSLNTITSFCRTNSEKARELLLDLSLYMRRNLDLSRKFIPLSEELEQVQSYLAIEKARFGERIQVNINIDEQLHNWPIPPLIIQPLVENSIKHGILPLEEGGIVSIDAQQQGDILEIVIADNGVGMNEQALNKVQSSCDYSYHDGIGMRNCFCRHEQIYGAPFAPILFSKYGEGTSITLKFPIIE